MAVSFPTSPSTGDTYDVGRVRYEWSGSAWKQIASQPVSTGAEIPFTKADGSTSDPIKLASSVIGDALVNDSTPQLGGDLDVNGNSIVSASNANINITPNGSGYVVLDGLSWPRADGSPNQILKTDGSGALSWVADAAGTITALNNATEGELVTVGSTTTELDGESGLTYDGTTLVVSGSIDLSGDIDVDGTLEADAITLNGSALGALYSPLAGSGSIATVGTVGTGTWAATDVAVAHGGTGASTASAARTNLGIVNGVANTVSSHGPYGSGANGAISNITDTDINGTTVAQSGTITLTSNRIIRATSTVTLSQAITVNKQSGQVRGSYPTTHGGIGIELGAILATLGSKGIPVPIRPAGGTASLCGGIVQIIASGNVVVGGTITADGTNASSDGGGGGGLVVIISGGTISGSSAISVAGSAGHATAAARGGAGSYSGEPGGHAGIGGSGGGGGGSYFGGGAKGSGGSGIIDGNDGGHAVGGSNRHGGGGGSLDNEGSDGGSGGAGNGYLANYYTGHASDLTLGNMTSVRATVSTSGSGYGAGGSNGGGGGGGS